ncbi:MAG: PDZ domain-containing protein [Candidatus Omnitrophica bacterium]|nr:PDZ domain-containing protein [Candidatus Omnitrophota bacterium]
MEIRRKIRFIPKAAEYLFLSAMCLFFLASGISAGDNAADIQKQVEAAISSVKPALVRIRVVTTDYYQGREEDTEGFGSGVIINKEGYVVTNHHVAGKAKRITCTLSDKSEIEGRLAGTDPLSDIAVIQLIPGEKKDFPFAGFSDSSKLKVGDRVLAMGSPYAFSQSVTMGIVSNTSLVMPPASFYKLTMEGEDVGSLVRWIGHDAPIYGGNSGGPLVSIEGKIVGINEIKMGLGGAIPGNLVQDVVRQIIEKGEVVRSWTGLEVQPLLKSSGRDSGVLVSGAIKGSPADKAGFLPGDILLELDRKPVSVRFDEEMPLFNQLVAGIPPGRGIAAAVLRSGKKITLNLTTEKREAARFRLQELKQWGFVGNNISAMSAREMKRDSRDGILVADVRPGGPCDSARPRISSGDIITEVNGSLFADIERLAVFTEKLMKGAENPVPALVSFERRGEQHITVVKVGIPKLQDSGVEVSKAWIPAGIQVLTREIAEHINIPGVTGVRVTQVYPDSSASKAGLKAGDLIIALNGEKIPAYNPQDLDVLPAMVRQYRIGDEVELAVLRNLKEMKIKMKLSASPKLPREMKKYRDDNFGFTAREIAFQDVIREKGIEEQGVMVEAVERGSWAALGDLRTGDIIIRVNGQSAGNISLLEEAMEKIAADKPKTAVFQVRRGIYLMYLEFEPLWL